MENLADRSVIFLLAGLSVALVVAIGGWIKRRPLVRDNRLLREHLHTQMTISARGNQASLDEIAQLKRENENLRISLASLRNRPDKSELRSLYLYDTAIHLMYEKAPGFAPAWEAILKEAEIEMEKASTGVVAWVRKVVRPGLSGGRSNGSTPGGHKRSDISVMRVDEKSERGG